MMNTGIIDTHIFIQYIIVLVVVFELEQSFQEIPDRFPENDDGTQYGSGMYHHFENQVVRRFNSEEFASDDKMSAAADRQKFRKSLDQSENYSFKPFHRLIAFTVFFLMHNGADDDDDTRYDDNGSRHKTPEIKHVVIEDLRVLDTASGHQNITANHKDHSR